MLGALGRGQIEMGQYRQVQGLWPITAMEREEEIDLMLQ